MRIIFVEDNEYLRDTMVEMLEGAGREIVACERAEDALAAFERDGADVIITDVSLPGMSGIDLARRAIERVPGTWVIVSSGYAFDRGLETLGPTVRSLPKPFEIEAMDELLEEIRLARGG